MSTTPVLNLPLLAEGQTGKDLDHNKAIYILETFCSNGIIDRDLTDAPATPTEGDAYIVATGGINAWFGQDENVAISINGAWYFITPVEGMTLWVQDELLNVTFVSGNWAIQPALSFSVPIVRVAGTAYTATLADFASLIQFDNAGACTLTLPENATEAIPEGYQIMVRNKGVGTLSLATQGTDTIENGTIVTNPKVLTSILLETSGTPNNWIATGDLT